MTPDGMTRLTALAQTDPVALRELQEMTWTLTNAQVQVTAFTKLMEMLLPAMGDTLRQHVEHVLEPILHPPAFDPDEAA